VLTEAANRFENAPIDLILQHKSQLLCLELLLCSM
jgi:hypothetical protein